MEYHRITDNIFGLSFEERHRLVAKILERDYMFCDGSDMRVCIACWANTSHQPRYTEREHALFITWVCRSCKIIEEEPDDSPDYGVFRLTSEERHYLLLKLIDMYIDIRCYVFRRCEVCNKKTSTYRISYSVCQYGWCRTTICHDCQTDIRQPYKCIHHRNPTLCSMSFRYIKYGII